MDTFKIEHDIIVYGVTATSFPEGIEKAHQKIKAYAPPISGRNYYAISQPDETGRIIYKAAATEINKDELAIQKLEKFIIPQGEYFRVIINDYTKGFSLVGQAFDEIIAHPDIDPQGFCLEWYKTDSTMWCMVRVADR